MLPETSQPGNELDDIKLMQRDAQHKELIATLEALTMATLKDKKTELKGAELVTIKGEKGDKGDKGDKGEKGDSITGPQGPKGEKGEKGDPGKDGKDGKDGRDGVDGKPGKDGKDGKAGKTGPQGSPDTAEQIRDKLKGLKRGQRLHFDDLDGTEWVDKLQLGRHSPHATGRLQDLVDVLVTVEPSNGQVLAWNSTSKDWQPTTVSGGGGTWGSITGTLSNQTDLQTALDGKVDENTAITGATKTKVTYDAKGLVTAGADATTADIADSTNKRYVTDAQLTVLGNTSGTNTGDQTSIVGITGTKAQFDTAVTDGNFLYVGDITQYTDEMAQDAVGGILTDTATIDFTYDDATPAITADVKDGSISLAKQANVATSTVFYRKTAGTGSPEVQTLATLKTDLGLTGTNSGDQTITLTGDVTGSGTGSFATTIANGSVDIAMLSATGTPSASTYLRGDNTWATVAGTGDVSKVGTPVNNQVGVWTGDGTLEGDTALTFDTATDTLAIGASGKLAFGAVNILEDSAGTTTLSNIDALDATTEATVEAAIDTLANLTSIQGQTVTLTGPFVRSGAHSLTLTTTGITDVTLPTTGTLATLAGAESLTNKKLGSLTSNGFVKTSGGDGTLSVDTTSYQTLDSTLTALAAYNANGILTQTAADTFVGRTITGTAAQITVTNGDGVAGNPTLSLPADVLIPTVLTVPNTGLHLLDTDASHDLIIKPGSNLTADHTLTITTGDADRTLTISASATVSQDYSTSGTPQFAGIELNHASANTLTASGGHMTIEGATVWDSGNDGSGSGLDADLLDGKNTGTSGNVVPLLDGANTWSALQTFSLAGNTIRAVNTTDNASVQVAKLEGDRATMAANDEAYLSLHLSDSAGNQDEFARITWRGTTVTNTSEAGRLAFSVATAGTLAEELYLTGTALSPAANDGNALGTTSLMWADLFLANGGVVNWNNGNVSLAHSAGQLTATVDSLVLVGQTGTGGHSLPQIILKSQDTTTPTGAGGFLRFETPNASSVYVDGAQINGGLAVTTAGSEQGDLDLTVYRNGVQKTVALRGDWSAIAPGDDAMWDFGRSAQRFKDGYFSGAMTLGTIELGHASDTTLSRSSAGVLAVEGVVIPSISSTNTLTNKRVTPRVSTTTSSATPTINTDNVDMYGLTAQAADITSFTTNLSGTPTDGQKLWIYIVGTAARAITWGTSFEASTVSLPTTTVSTNRLDVGFVWNAATSKWRCIASA